MNPIRSLALLCLTLALCSTTTATEHAMPDASGKAANLLTNGDFERLGKRDLPERWITKQHAGQRAYEIIADPDRAHEGKYSLMIRRIREQVWGLTEQIVPAHDLAGQTARFSIWVRTADAGPQGATVYLGAYNGSLMLEEARSAPITGSNDWTRFELDLRVPEFTTHLQVGISLHDAGTAWIDNAELQVKRAAAAPTATAQ